MKNVIIGLLTASTAVLGFLLYQERQEPSVSEALEAMMTTTKPAVDDLAKAIAQELKAAEQTEP
jgi:hypothetical protein